MVLFPNAKINLGLFVNEKRSDAYHSIESILYPIPLCDALELLPSPDGKFKFSATGIPIQGDAANNLCVKAWELLQKDFDLPPVHIHLHKAIPMGAGLGGGSSDAAFTLKLANQEFELGLSDEKIEQYAGRLGMDCPFFVHPKPARVYDRGDKLEAIPLDLSGKYLVVVKPDCHISTQEAYAGIEPAFPKTPISELIKLPLEDWKNTLFNDFEKSLFVKFLEIGDIKGSLYKHGAVYASMSGSGSAVFGIFEKEVDLENIFPDAFYWSSWI